jgi:general stress protein YciG
MAENSDRDYGAGDDGRERDGVSRSSTDEGAEQGTRNGKSNRGFASMSPERQREIASKGGRAAHEKGTAHEWTPDEARRAGRKGGETVSRDRAHMAAIGREGGGARSARRNTPPRGSDAVQSNDTEQRGNRNERDDNRNESGNR